MAKLGMKPVTGIYRVTLKRQKTVCVAFLIYQTQWQAQVLSYKRDRIGKKARDNIESEKSQENHLIEQFIDRSQYLFVINKPEVFKSPNADTYIIFGEAKVEDISQNLGTNALERLQGAAAKAGATAQPAVTEAKPAATTTTATTTTTTPTATAASKAADVSSSVLCHSF